MTEPSDAKTPSPEDTEMDQGFEEWFRQRQDETNGHCSGHATCMQRTFAAGVTRGRADERAEIAGTQCSSRFRSGGAFDSDLCCLKNQDHDGPHEQMGVQWPNWSLDFNDPRRTEAILCVSLQHADLQSDLSTARQKIEELERKVDEQGKAWLKLWNEKQEDVARLAELSARQTSVPPQKRDEELEKELAAARAQIATEYVRGREHERAAKLDADASWKTRAEEYEWELRHLWWLNHGCHIAALYGDDGEMQCNAQTCMRDFKRDDLQALRWHRSVRLQAISSEPSSTVSSDDPVEGEK